jgi:hypothetical protein
MLLRLARARTPRLAKRLHCESDRFSESRLQATQSSAAQQATRHCATDALGAGGGGSAAAPEMEVDASRVVSQQLLAPAPAKLGANARATDKSRLQGSLRWCPAIVLVVAGAAHPLAAER